MYIFRFDKDKNYKLRSERGISFEVAIQAINDKKILATMSHYNKECYEHQGLYIIEVKNYAYIVPYVKDEEKQEIFLKTIFPSRKMTKIYLKRGSKDG